MRQVWITDTKTSGTVIQKRTSPRSYFVDAPQEVMRRNRLHLIPLQTPSQAEATAYSHSQSLEQDNMSPPLSFITKVVCGPANVKDCLYTYSPLSPLTSSRPTSQCGGQRVNKGLTFLKRILHYIKHKINSVYNT